MYILFCFISAILVILGYYLYEKKNSLYVLFLGLAIAVNYYSTFGILFFEIACSKKTLKKVVAFILELIPINIVYIIEHFVFPETNACFWLPDFMLWTELFEAHFLNVFYWFWVAYILFLCYGLYISLNDSKSDVEKGIIGGFVIYSGSNFFQHVNITSYVFLLLFTIVYAYRYLDLKDSTNLYLLIAFIAGNVSIALTLPDFGNIAIFVQALFDKLSFLGFEFVVIAMTAAITIDFSRQWNKQLNVKHKEEA